MTDIYTLDLALFAVVVGMSILTTLIAPFALRRINPPPAAAPG